MTSLPYIRFTESMTKVGECCTLIINSFLIYLTIYYIKNIKGGYKILVLALANLEILFALLEFLIHPFVHSYNSSYTFFTIDKVYGASKTLKILGLCLYSGVYALLICLIAIQFLYRYFLITGAAPNVIILLNRWCWVYCTFWSFMFMFAYYQCVPDKDSEDYLREAMVKEYNKDVEEVAGLFLVFFSPRTGAIRLRTFISVAIFSTTLSFQYAVIIFCGYEIHKKLNSSALKMSGRAHGMQRQLFKTLIFQILNPCIFHHIPAFIILIIPFLDLQVSIPSGLIFCFYSVFPPVDSLVMMYLVTEYKVIMRRRSEAFLLALLNWIKKLAIGEEQTMTTEA